MTSPIKFAVDADGVAIVTLDAPDASTNTIGPAFSAAFADMIERLSADATIKGAVITSAKPSFVVGGNLNGLGALATAAEMDGQTLLDTLMAFPHLLRKMETCGKPVAAAINGTAMGGGLELTLACHYRVIADDPTIQLALPEVKVGLMPGAGGTQRLPRLIGIEAAVPLMLEGKSVDPAKAAALGFVNAVVPKDELLARARQWVLANPDAAVQPWDRKGFAVPGGAGILDRKGIAYFYTANGMLQAATLHNYPAPKAIMSAVYEGTMLTIDGGLAVEGRYMASLFRSPVAGNMIRSLFINKQKADKLAYRPAGFPTKRVAKLGVLGAGMMGAGIAQVAAQQGIDVVLMDRDADKAAAGKAGIAARLGKLVAKGKMGDAAVAALLERIAPSADYSDLAGADLVIEAVFEDPAIKADVTRASEAVIPPDALIASNTSTLRISTLAKASSRPDKFIGMHFFSPVDRMPLVEIILGERTSDETLATALDFVRQIRKTPIVVRDSWGFYTSRCFATFTGEGMAMLEEGIAPALIENGARFAGMPVGPLTVQDEVSLELSYQVQKSLRAMMGDAYRNGMESASDRVIAAMVEQEKRLGRRGGKGFYDYPEDGPKRLWPGLGKRFPVRAEQPTLEEVKTRFLFRQAVEAARCLDEGIVMRPEDADIGALLGWSFPSYTGGPVSLIDMVGPAAFVAKCDRLTAELGERFAVPPSLRAMAEKGGSYSRLNT